MTPKVPRCAVCDKVGLWVRYLIRLRMMFKVPLGCSEPLEVSHALNGNKVSAMLGSVGYGAHTTGRKKRWSCSPGV